MTSIRGAGMRHGFQPTRGSWAHRSSKGSTWLAALAFACFVLAPATGLGIGIEDIVDGGNDFAWERIELPGTVCGNGSQYKFFVYDSATSNDLVILFEGGGACWDYPSCSGAAGILSAANRDGITDDYIYDFQPQYVSPILNGADPGIPGRPKNPIVTEGWDVVYMPYCTGDVHVGNNVATYVDDTGQNPPIVWNHAGFQNTRSAMQYLASRFPNVGKMLVTGFSAGGAATSAAFYEIRRTIAPAEGYLLNDSGPLFPAPDASSNSRPLHEEIRSVWGLDSVFGELPASFDPNDYGSINAMIATEYPGDEMAYTGYSTDFNYSRYSYERFYPGIDQAGMLALWQEDQADLIAELNQQPNFSYHVPWNRPINDSHCSTIITFIGSHACPTVRKKRWYERWQWPWSQSWKCPSGFTPIETFLDNWVGNDQRSRIVEPPNDYNLEDPGMQIIVGLIDQVL